MKSRVVGLLAIVGLCFLSVIAGSQVARAQGQGRVIVPDTTAEHPEDVGKRAHTNHVIFLRSSGLTLTVPSGETPGSLACVYGIAQSLTSGCPKTSTSLPSPSTSGGVIAIVDAFDYPTAQNDFDKFSTQFGLPLSTSNVCNSGQPCFVKIYANGVPKKNCGWAQEAALDIEWAHAMAPSAQIVLVEAKSNSFTDLFKAVDVATAYVTAHSAVGGQVSMSWGGSEFKSEATNDSHFSHNGVVYFAASGDTGGATIYPSTSPNVVSAGGTRVNRDANGNFTNETGWSGSGGGPSKYESIPSYQGVIASIVGSKRGTPDFSFDADPSTGVSVYDSTSCQGLSGWLVFGGTSVSSPSLAGIVNEAGSKYSTSTNELNAIYSDYATPANYSSDYRDVTSGTAGSFSAKTGWDFVTGVGSNIGTSGK
jgi:subtilase family serine protease